MSVRVSGLTPAPDIGVSLVTDHCFTGENLSLFGLCICSIVMVSAFRPKNEVIPYTLRYSYTDRKVKI